MLSVPGNDVSGAGSGLPTHRSPFVGASQVSISPAHPEGPGEVLDLPCSHFPTTSSSALAQGYEPYLDRPEVGRSPQSSLGFLGSPNQKPSVLAVLRGPGQSQSLLQGDGGWEQLLGAALAEVVP